jgi:CTP:molybdopterin cytidylyltransferase MocA
MGFDKTVRRTGSLAPLERVARALGERQSVVVVQPRLQAAVRAMLPRAQTAINEQAWRGMASSLRAGLRAFAASEPFGVLLADMPAMTESTLARTEALFEGGADVAFPVDAGGLPGHPVLFSARARPVIEALPDGDTLRLARDHPSLRRATWVCTDRSAFLDLDVPAQWHAFTDA